MPSTLSSEAGRQCPELRGSLMGTESTAQPSHPGCKINVRFLNSSPTSSFSFPLRSHQWNTRCVLKTQSSTVTQKPSTSPGCVSCWKKKFLMAQGGGPAAWFIRISLPHSQMSPDYTGNSSPQNQMWQHRSWIPRRVYSASSIPSLPFPPLLCTLLISEWGWGVRTEQTGPPNQLSLSYTIIALKEHCYHSTSE